MSRMPRKKSNSGIYHVMLRGADRRIIFSDEEDCDRFLETVGRVKEISGFKLYAYCLMGNHVHLLLLVCIPFFSSLRGAPRRRGRAHLSNLPLLPIHAKHHDANERRARTRMDSSAASSV